VVRLAVGLPLEVEAHRHLVATGAAGAVQLDGILDADAVDLVGQLPALERVGADVVGPQGVAADLQAGGRRRQRHLEVADGDGLASRAAHVGVVPAALQVRVQADAHPPADRPVAGGEVEVPRLAPELLGSGLVDGLVGGVDPGTSVAHAVRLR
jgi:hypothetical protein